MKKVLATVAALGLVLGVAGNVLALDKPGKADAGEATTAPRVPQPTAPGVALWSVSGSWVLAGAYLSNGWGAPGAANMLMETGADAFYIYSFKVLPVLQVNDKIAVKGQLRFADRDVFGLTNNAIGAAGAFEGRTMDTYHLYMEWMSPLGKTRFGRTPCGAWGSKFRDSSSNCSRLMLWGNWMPENMGMLLFTQKSAEADAGLWSSDADTDLYYIDVSYKADYGKTTAALLFGRNATANDGAGVAADNFTTARYWMHGKYKFDNIGVEYEIEYNFGEASATMDQDSLGLYLDASMGMGDATVGARFIYASGDDNLADNDASALGATGNDFNVYQLAMGDYMNIFNADNPLTAVPQQYNANYGLWSLGVYGSLKMSPKMTMTAELGYFGALEEPTGADDEWGWEAGVGMSYKLYDNLTYSAHFSYFATGDAWLTGNAVAGASTTTEDVYLLAHALSMKF